MVGRTKEKAGAPPVQGLLEGIASPAPLDKTVSLQRYVRKKIVLKTVFFE